MKIYDITPTVLHLLGLPVPKDMDGRVFIEIIDDESEPGKREVAFVEMNQEVERIRFKIEEMKKLKHL